MVIIFNIMQIILKLRDELLRLYKASFLVKLLTFEIKIDLKKIHNFV